MQDLIGCRIVIFDAIDQEKCLADLVTLFPTAKYDDRRDKARYGYRAIHVVPRNGRQRFEIQLRTRFQDEWANIVEKVADRVGIEVKYGGGEAQLLVTTEALPPGTPIIVGFAGAPGEDRAYVCDVDESSEAALDEANVSRVDGTASARRNDKSLVRTNTPGPGVPRFFFQFIGFEGGLGVYNRYSDLLSEVDRLYTEVGSLMRRIESGLG